MVAAGVFVLGAFGADFVSGLVHWSADTWGRETLPVIGRRLLRPFRVHHVNPDDFTRRRFLDVNGDVAIDRRFVLAAGAALASGSAVGTARRGFLFSFCLVGLPTNQVHQWAHMRRPPAFRSVSATKRGHFEPRRAFAAPCGPLCAALLHRDRLV